jgi:hypothetical protein
MPSTPTKHFSRAHGAGGRLLSEHQGQRQDHAGAGEPPVLGEAPDPFCCNASRDRPRSWDHLCDPGQGVTGAHQGRLVGSAWIVELLANGSRDGKSSAPGWIRLDQRRPRHDRLHFREELLACALHLGGGELVIGESELLAADHLTTICLQLRFHCLREKFGLPESLKYSYILQADKA